MTNKLKQDQLDLQRKINHTLDHTKYNNKNQKTFLATTHIFTFEPSVFWDDPEEADVVHIYIIAKLLSIKYLSSKTYKLTYHFLFFAVLKIIFQDFL